MTLPSARNTLIHFKKSEKPDLVGPMPRWTVALTTRSPHNPFGDSWSVGIDQGLLAMIVKNGHEQKLARLKCLQEVLSRPDAIFRGWDRPDRASCFVYAGHPAHDYKTTSIELPPIPKMIFLVFILPDGTIDDWGWRPLDPERAGLPEGITGEIVWKA